MSRVVFFAAAALFAGGAVAGSAQALPDTNPYHGSSATFGNYRPLIEHKQKPPTSKTVKGMVTDDSGKPVSGALVTLTDKGTKEHQQFFTKKDGHYQFEGLSFNKDYQVQASYKGRQSSLKTISQYDHTASQVRMLDIPSPAVASKAKPSPTTAARADTKK